MDQIQRKEDGSLVIFDSVFYPVSPGGMEEEFEYRFSPEQVKALEAQLAKDHPGKSVEEALSEYSGDTLREYLIKNKLQFSLL